MRWKPYPKYKDSGVEWLGEVPEHWEMFPLKRVTNVQLSNVDKHAIEGEQSIRLCNYVDVYKNERIIPSIDFMVATATTEQIKRLSLRLGDVLITKDSETPNDIGVPALVSEEVEGVVCGYHLALIRPNTGFAVGTYIARLLSCSYVKAYFETTAVGMTRYGLGKYAIENLLVPIPTVDEQRAIAAFLDAETARIDSLIADYESLIALLREERQAAISHAVTKGLNPNVLMKNSGIEWLGEVPEHWDAIDFRRTLSKQLSNGIFKKRESFGSGVQLVNVSDIYQDDFKVNQFALGRVECSQTEVDTYRVMNGDLLFVRSSLKEEGIAVTAIVDNLNEDTVFECHLILARPDKSSVDSLYLVYYMNSSQVRAKLISSAKTATMTTIDQESILSKKLLVPPLYEQRTIAAFLDAETARIDSLIADAEKAIELLRENHTALISDAVTGKLDVRDWQKESV